MLIPGNYIPITLRSTLGKYFNSHNRLQELAESYGFHLGA